MATTYTLISLNVLSSSAASVSFTSIPATYTDLVVRMSTRNIGANTGNTLKLTFNADSTTKYSDTSLKGNGSAASSTRNSNSAFFDFGLNPGASSTTNTFCNTEIYIPSYLVAQNKAMSVFNIDENNTTAADLNAGAGQYRSTTAISSIEFTGGSNYASGSSFYLYGISNA